MKPGSIDALLNCFVTAKANSFENLLDPFLKISRLSASVTILLAKSSFFSRLIDRLAHSKAVVRLNLLRILRAVCDAHPNRPMLVERYKLDSIVERVSREDGAVLVRELAREIVPTLRPALSAKGDGKKGVVAPKKTRRTASETSVIGAPSPKSKLTNGSPKPRAWRVKLGELS